MSDIVSYVGSLRLAQSLPDAYRKALGSVASAATVSGALPPTVTATAFVSTDGKSVVFAPGFQQDTSGQAAVEAAGAVILALSGQEGQRLWQDKLVKACPGAVDEFNGKLSSGQYSQFRGIVDSFTNPVGRLVALHLANAFIGSYTPIAAATGLDIKTWPKTAEFCSGGARYSLTPLVSAYCQPELWQSFPKAFYARVTKGNIPSSHTAVGAEFDKLMDEIVALAQ